MHSDESLIRETQAIAWWESISETEKRTIIRQADKGHYGAQEAIADVMDEIEDTQGKEGTQRFLDWCRKGR